MHRAAGKPVLRHRSRARPCRARSPDLDLFVIRRSQTTDRETHIMTMEISGETHSDARMASEGPRDTKKNVPLPVGRGPVPRRASVGETALAGVQFSRRSGTRGGNPLACAYGRRGPPRCGPGRGFPLHVPFGSRCSRTTVSSPYNLANLVNRVNPAPLLLIL